MRYIYLILFLATLSSSLFSQNVVIDKRAIEQVVKNSASAVAKEKLVESSLSKARKAQETINKYTAIVHANLELIEYSKQSISAFKEGTSNFKVLNNYLIACFNELGLLASDIKRYPLGTLAYSKHITNISLHIVSIANDISNTVTDGKVSIKGANIGAKVINLIDPIKRLEIMNKCIYELQRVFSLLRDIRINIQMRNTMRDVSLALIPTATVSADMLKEIQKDVVRLWYE